MNKAHKYNLNNDHFKRTDTFVKDFKFDDHNRPLANFYSIQALGYELRNDLN